MSLAIADGIVLDCTAPGRPANSILKVGVRAEAVGLMRAPTRVHHDHPAVVRLVTFLGQTVRLLVEAGDLSIVSETAASAYDECPRVGEHVFIDIDERAVHLLDDAAA
jgi:hypothetical protein